MGLPDEEALSADQRRSDFMAYSFTDIYRPLRAILRLNGLLIGCGLGGVLLLASPVMLLRWGLLTRPPIGQLA